MQHVWIILARLVCKRYLTRFLFKHCIHILHYSWRLLLWFNFKSSPIPVTILRQNIGNMQEPWTKFRNIKQAIRDPLGVLLNLVYSVAYRRGAVWKSNFKMVWFTKYSRIQVINSVHFEDTIKKYWYRTFHKMCRLHFRHVRWTKGTKETNLWNLSWCKELC